MSEVNCCHSIVDVYDGIKAERKTTICIRDNELNKLLAIMACVFLVNVWSIVQDLRYTWLSLG